MIISNSLTQFNIINPYNVLLTGALSSVQDGYSDWQLAAISQFESLGLNAQIFIPFTEQWVDTEDYRSKPNYGWQQQALDQCFVILNFKPKSNSTLGIGTFYCNRFTGVMYGRGSPNEQIRRRSLDHFFYYFGNAPIFYKLSELTESVYRLVNFCQNN